MDIHCLNCVLVLPYGAAALWKTEESEEGARDCWDGPGEHESNTRGNVKVNMHKYSVAVLHILQGEYKFSPEILEGKLAQIVYKDATGKMKGTAQ